MVQLVGVLLDVLDGVVDFAHGDVADAFPLEETRMGLQEKVIFHFSVCV